VKITERVSKRRQIQQGKRTRENENENENGT
jgi:hypothetical protein